MSARLPRRVAAYVVLVPLLPALGGCGLFGDDAEESGVQQIEVGACYQSPTEVKAQISRLDEVACDEPHDLEAFAIVEYVSADPDAGDAYPGDAVVEQFADGHCAQEFAGYVGEPYQDADGLFITYLLPNAVGWNADDRTIPCFLRSPGRPLSESMRDSAG